MGGGTPPCRDFFSVNFLAGRVPWWGGEGYPSLPWLKNLLKIGPKTVFFRQKTPFLAKKFQAACRDGGGRGTPLCRDFFSVNFLAGRLPWWGEGAGGVPPSRHKAVIGVFERFPNNTQLLKYDTTCSVASKRYCTNSTLCSGLASNEEDSFLPIAVEGTVIVKCYFWTM